MKYYGTKDGKDYGFYLEEDGLISYKTISDTDWQDYISQANQDGKELSHDENGNPIIIDRIISEEEKKNQELQNAYSYLRQTDYVAAKLAEGVATKEEYSEILTKRAEARKRINELNT